jgi:hypothetical protein
VKTYEEIRRIIDPHEQRRGLSCVQSAVEMVLKLNGLVPGGTHPEQDIVDLDEMGFAPYDALGTKHFNDVAVGFREVKFDKRLCQNWRAAAWAAGLKLLQTDIYPIYSFQVPAGYHCYVGIPDAADEMQFITKPKTGRCEAEIQGRHGIWAHQFKTEILVVRRL